MSARRQTSIVTYDPGDGVRTFIVPNIDFAPAAGKTPRAPPDVEKQRYNLTIARTCKLEKLPPGLGFARRCVISEPMDIQAVAPGLPATVRCAPGPVSIFPDGRFGACQLSDNTQFMNSISQNAPTICPAHHTLGATIEGSGRTGYGFCKQ